MNHIFQNMKSGFANMKELFGIFLSVDDYSDDDCYSKYINSNDSNLSKQASLLKEDEINRDNRLSNVFTTKRRKKESSIKKKINIDETSIDNETSSERIASHKNISSDVHTRKGTEPEI